MEGGAPKGRRLDGESAMKESEENRLKCVVYESTRAPLRGPPSPMGKAAIRGYRFSRHNAFPKGKAKRRRLRRPKRKPTPPRCARQPLPREGARVVTPSFLWKEVPRRGRRLDGKSGMKESEGDHLKYAVCESTLSTALLAPFPNGEGGEQSEPDRVLAV
ncbi:MAG: hypothetical protein EGR19_05175 [Dialister sp.]|nr:hypothetical protein [Dialister sp.]MBD9031580.1 hypothetical protein [Dialister sp.]